MSNYFRVTGYHPQSNCSFIADSYGKFEKLWQFSSNLLSYGVKVIEVNRFEDSKDLNIGTIEENKDSFVLRAVAKGKPKIIEKEDKKPFNFRDMFDEKGNFKKKL